MLDHTYSGVSFYDVRLNGDSVSEAELNAALAGAHGDRPGTHRLSEIKDSCQLR